VITRPYPFAHLSLDQLIFLLRKEGWAHLSNKNLMLLEELFRRARKAEKQAEKL
jgi:hypothetical protein